MRCRECSPDIAGPPLLADPGLVLAPDLDPLGFGMGTGDLVQGRGKGSIGRSVN